MRPRIRIPYTLRVVLCYAAIVFIGVAVIYLLFGVGSLLGPDRGSWSKESIHWDYGSIVLDDEKNDVAYSSGFNSLYTKDLIACTGFQFTLSLPAGVQLDVYYFDTEDNYLGVKYIRGERFVKFLPGSDELPEGVAGIRLCMTPDGGNDVFKMPLLNVGNFMQKLKYSGYVKLEITNSDKVTIDNVNGI